MYEKNTQLSPYGFQQFREVRNPGYLRKTTVKLEKLWLDPAWDEMSIVYSTKQK